MASDPVERRSLSVLRHKRDATRYQILVEIARRQPAVSQREIADVIGITAQAVSEYVGTLVEEGYVLKEGRGRYQITKEGVDWLISRTDELREFTTYVAEEVIERVEIEAAVATDPIEEGSSVTLSMHDGVLHATPGLTGAATAVAVSGASAGEAVGVTDFSGLLDYDPGTVTILTVPPISAGPSDIDRSVLDDHATTVNLLAVAGVEALVTARAANLEPDIQFGTTAAVLEAATRGLDVALIAVESAVSSHTDRLREENLGYEVVDLVDRGTAR